MSQVTWAFGEVTGTEDAFQRTTAHNEKQKDASGAPVETSYRGEIKIMLHANTSGAAKGMAGKTIVAYPANMNMTRIPLIGEHVLCFQGPGKEMGPQGPAPKTTDSIKAGDKNTGNTFDLEWYYFDPLSIQGSVHTNLNPGANVGAVVGPDAPTTVQDGETKTKADVYEESSAGNPTTNSTATTTKTVPDTQNTTDTAPGNEFKEVANVNNPQPFEGDVILQGRSGHSIRLGATVDVSGTSESENRYQKLPSWGSGESGAQGPIIIMRAGASESQKNENNDYIIEKINEDKSSIYVCSGQQIPIAVASPNFDALNHQNKGCPDSVVNESGTSINSTHCNASGGSTSPVEPLDPIPENVEELPLVEGEWPKYNTSTGKVSGMGKLRLIQGVPFFENLCPHVLSLLKQAKEDGMNLQINSGYRGIRNVVVNGKQYASGQLDLRKQNARDRSWKTEAQMNDTNSKLWRASSGNFSPATAAPGFSKHQNGIAMDVNSHSRTSKTGIYNWLVNNAYKHGFIRTVSSEEWHFEYRPGKKTFDKVSAGNSKWHGHQRGHIHNA